MNILIAEDDAVSALVLRKTLVKLGHTVTTAADGAEAWQQIEQAPCEVLISDWMMPEMDGLELCRRLRARAGSPYIYVILLTAKGQRADRLAGLRAGADDFLVKPLDTIELIARLEVAQRLLTMQEELRDRSEWLTTLSQELRSQNQRLEKTMLCLERANHRYAELFEGVPVACYAYDLEGAICEWNRAATAMFGFLPEEALTRPVWEVFAEPIPLHQTENIQRQQERLQRLVAGEPEVGIARAIRHRSGKRLSALCYTFPIRLPDGQIIGAISANVDITERTALEEKVAEQLRQANGLNTELERQQHELAKANAQLAELVTTDSLTGLKNRRCFLKRLEGYFTQPLQHKAAISVVMVDVDAFKQYNDTFGHTAGDEILSDIGTILQANLRGQDTVARYGGEEFVILLPGSDAIIAQEIAERLRAAIERRESPLRPVTASFGVATRSATTPNAAALIEEADQALYASKHQGRNRVTHFRELALQPECMETGK